MKLTQEEISEIQSKYSYLTNFEDDDPTAPIHPVNYVDSNGDALLHIAAQLGDKRTVELLLNVGIDVNLLGDMSNTALHYAAISGSSDLYEYLCSKGASEQILNEFGKTPLDRRSA
jgi:ankyrin repeat protein